MPQPCDACVGEGQTGCASRDGQGQTLRELFADQPPAAAAKRGANRYFPSACRGTRDQQVRNVETSYQQYAAGCSEQRVQRVL